MKKHLLAIIIATLLLCPFCRAGNYTNFEVAVYIPVNVVKNLANSNVLVGQWNWIYSQLKVDKVYIEVQRDRHDEPFTTFKVNVPPHSYLVFSAEPNNDSGH